ncbi:MAG: protein TolR [Deltaproteobacteria bacterium]|nr:protein TolR [Deltaproteobacteria bacterium]
MANKKLLSQINVTPLVDVILVLLIIFMVTAPMMQTGIDVKLPEVETSSIKTTDEPVIVTITKKGNIYINKTSVELGSLKKKLQAIFKRRPDNALLLKADASVPYGQVAKAMAEIRKAGIQKVGMVTEPLPTNN